MPHSFAQKHNIACPHCQLEFYADIWLLIDINERQDLVNQILAEQIHKIQCIHCNGMLVPDWPIWLYDKFADYNWIYSPENQPNKDFYIRLQAILLKIMQQNLSQFNWISGSSHYVTAKSNLPNVLLKKSHNTLVKSHLPIQDIIYLLKQQDELASKISLINHGLQEIATILNPFLVSFLYMQQNQKNNFDINAIKNEFDEIFQLQAFLHTELANVFLQTDIEHAIYHYKQAIEGYDPLNNFSEWSIVRGNLANAYFYRSLGNRKDNIEASIKLLLEIIHHDKFETYDLRKKCKIYTKIGNAYCERLIGNKDDNLNDAIKFYQKGLDICGKETSPNDWATTKNGLGTAYINQGTKESLEKAIFCLKEALSEFKQKEHPDDWAMVHHNLSSAYAKRIIGNKANNMEKAIQHCKLALIVRDINNSPENWAMTNNELANHYKDRTKGSKSDNIEKAISIYHHILTTNLPDWLSAMVKNNLASAYRQRIQGDIHENLKRAIGFLRQALEIYNKHDFPDQYAETHNNLGNVFCSYFSTSEAIEQSIKHYQEALTIFSKQHHPEQWGMAKNNLANAYRERVKGQRRTNLELAIKLYKKALLVRTKEDLPHAWATTQNNLATAYFLLGQEYSENTFDIAISHYKNALDIYTEQTYPIDWAMIQNNLGVIYHKFSAKVTAYFHSAILHYRQALKIRDAYSFPLEHFQTQRNLGDIFFSNHDWEKTAQSYAGAIIANKILFKNTLNREGGLTTITETETIFPRTAYTLLQLGRFGEALVQLDEGKARLLTQAVGQEEADIALLTDEEQEQFAQARVTFRELQLERQLPPNSPGRRPDSDLSPLQEAALNELNETIAHLRTAHPDFMPEGLSLVELLQLIPVGGALIAPVVTSHGGGVLVVPHGVQELTHAHYLPLPALSDIQVEAWLIGTEDADGWLRLYLDFINHRLPFSALAGWEAILHQVNQQLLAPVREKLAELHISHGAELLLMPQGGLGLLPLHQFWLDEYTVRYAPSGYAVQASLRRGAEGQRSGGAEGRLLAVVNPTGDLPFTPYEGEAVSNLFGEEKTLYHEGAASRTPILETLGQHDYLHFSCHGNFGWGDSDETGLSLANGERLTLRDILTHRLRPARLVTLSACETGMTDVTKAADEFLGLPAAFLQAGAIGVVGTLWAVNDLSTTLLMERFYTLHLGGMAPAQALRQAQIWLRDVTAGELAKQLSAQRRTLYQAGQSDNSHFDYVTAMADHFGEMEAAEQPYNHPYYWAAFTFSGV